MPFIDDGIWGDGDIYFSDSEVISGFIARQEAQAHHVAIRLRYIPTIIPGAVESFRILRVALHDAVGRQESFSHEAFIDLVESTDHIGLRVTHAGSEFNIRHAQIIAKERQAYIRG
jgi:hypothetical protein